jgi:uncharacterized protein YjbJ (UPF0337 family)
MYKEHTSLWEPIEGSWIQLRKEICKTWTWLTDDECEEIGGSRDALAHKLQEHYGIAEDDAYRRVDEWARNLVF